MRGGDEVDVVGALLLKVEHDTSQTFRLDLLARSIVTDIEVLTETAKEVAVGEEDGARSASSDQRVLFSEVRTEAREDSPAPGSAESPFIFQAVDPTPSRAQFTGSQPFDQSLCPGFEPP
jgi:hypothetical protein